MAKVKIEGTVMEITKNDDAKDDKGNSLNYFNVSLFQRGEKKLAVVKDVPAIIIQEYSIEETNTAEFEVKAIAWASNKGVADISYKFLNIAS